MPPRGRNTTLPPGNNHTGWYRDGVNGILEWYSSGTKIGQASGSTVTYSGAVNATGVLTSNAEFRVANGFNARLGTIQTFASTEPTNALVMFVGTNPVGAITTSGAIFVTTGGATISKIIAGSTVSQIEA